MNRVPEDSLPLSYSTQNVLVSDGCKRMRLSTYEKDVGSISLPFFGATRDGTEQKVGGAPFPGITDGETEQKMCKAPLKVTDHSDPIALTRLLQDLDSRKFGSVSKEIADLSSRHKQLLGPLIGSGFHMLTSLYRSSGRNQYKGMHELGKQQNTSFRNSEVIDLEDDDGKSTALSVRQPVVIIDSDDEEIIEQRPWPFQEVLLPKAAGEAHDRAIVVRHDSKNGVQERGDNHIYNEIQGCEDKGEYVGVEDDDPPSEKEDDGLVDIWKEMNMALEYSKENDEEPFHDENSSESEDCAHSFVLKDDLGYVCRVCGVIDKRIETIFEFQYNKGKKSAQTYMYEPRNTKDKKSTGIVGVKFTEDDFALTEISAHPRHMKQMKPHQVEGFNFLVSNLVAENPSGCIMAHAPGSGKTFMIISFMQSFLGKYPNAKPLVVLPKGILTTWKKEFMRWQVEDILLLDFYSVKADNRSQQLEVLRKWVEEKSILFLGYKQFSTIVCDSGTNLTTTYCKETLLKAPTILILDEGHTPRNENTDVLQSLARVQTPRKVVLSGTLYQNHVKEVFNILNLVRPKFLKLDTSRAVMKRIMSRVNAAGFKKQFKAGAETTFFDLVEHTLQKDEDFKRKAAVIQDLREMTRNVLHYYKGDFLEELPGLVDFTVVLNLSSRQRHEVKKLRNWDRKFKISSVGSAVYLHPKLASLSENCDSSDDKVDCLLEGLDLKDGAKARFFLNMLNLCESADEKLLVFSQYLLPLKFLERLAVKTKGWSLGREIFAITGDSSTEQREWSMEQFNNSCEAKVFFGSIKACGEGISLVGASRIMILDVHLNPSVTRQALGRAYRPGQKKKVYVYRLVAANSPEEEDHTTCFKKELISKLWFEWNEYSGFNDFEMQTIDIKNCDDEFLGSPLLRGGIEKLYKR